MPATPPGPAPATSLEQRLDEARAQILLHGQAGDAARCEAVYAAVLADARQRWTLQALRLWALRGLCLQAAAWSTSPPTVAQLDAFWQPIDAHFDHPPSPDLADRRAGDRALLKWHQLRHHGHGTEAQAREGQQVQQWLAAAAQDPRGAAAVALEQLGLAYYGATALADHMQRLWQGTSSTLGPGHRASLAALRALVFNHRQRSLPAQALALSDRYAALLAQYHPHDERLAMLNRSERVGALSGVGRHADALDEGLLLLAWLQRQQPTPHANIMRSAYNLASLCVELGDHDAAVAYAQLAADSGLQAPLASDRPEALFAVVLREQARTLRGDPGAVPALQAALQALPTQDLAIADALFTLARQAHRQAQGDTRAWAHNTFSALVARNAGALQPERALPLLLDVDAAPAGDEAAQQAASRVLAFGLVGRDLPLAVLSHFALARHVAAQHPASAIWLYKRGAQVLRTLREGQPGAAGGAHKAWLAVYEDDLRQFIGLLIDHGRLAEAAQAIEQLREEELQDFRRRSRGARAATEDTGARLQAVPGLSFTPHEQWRNQQLQPVQGALRAASASAEQRNDQQRAQMARGLAAGDAEVEAVLAQASLDILLLARQGADDSATPSPASAPARASVPALPAGTARISYFVRSTGIDAVVHTGTRRQHVQLPLGAVEASRQVQALRAALQSPAADVPAAAQHLHRALLAPLQPLLAGVRHLQLQPDGVLRYLPFAALHDGSRYVAQRYSVSVLLGQAALPGARPQPPRALARPRLVAFGRTQGDSSHSALPGVAQEVAALSTLRGARVLHALDGQFTQQTLAQALQPAPQVVHLASHFVLDAAGEEASYLLLGDGQRMPLRALRQLPWAGVQLALLSACDSALALDTPSADGVQRGRELTGFATTLHAAGVRNVMATLWRVDDATTAQWMQAFYAPWRHGARPAPAFTAVHLARTQRLWLRRHAGTALAHPHYWAAFTWMGQPA